MIVGRQMMNFPPFTGFDLSGREDLHSVSALFNHIEAFSHHTWPVLKAARLKGTAAVYDVNSIFRRFSSSYSWVFFCFLETWVDKTPQKVFLHCQSEYISTLAPVSLVSLLRLLVLSFTFTFCGSMSYFFFFLPTSFSFPLSQWGF